MNEKIKTYNTLFQQINWPRFLAIIWLLWTIISLFTTFQSGFYRAGKGEEVHWLHIFLYTYTSAIIWIGFTPVILWIAFKISIAPDKWPKTILIHLSLALLISSTQRFLYLSFDYFIQNHFGLWKLQMSYKDYLSSFYISRTIDGILTYFVILALFYGYFFYLKNLENQSIQAQLMTNLNKSRIQNLKHQIQPHFLFNSMQVISNLMYKNVSLADEAITQLSDLLRLSVKQLDVDEILLSEEISAIKKYLHFQKLRFGKNIVSIIEWEDDVLSYKVPAMLLQPFVENSIKYGFEKTGKLTKIKINFKSRAGQLHLCIEDNGPGFNQTDINNSKGIGIKNVLTRLESLYKDQFDFQIESVESTTSVHIFIPILK